MLPRCKRPLQKYCTSAKFVDENPVFNVTAEELARLHPLVRAVIGAVTCNSVETTTVSDSRGCVQSVRSKRKKQHASGRSLHSLLNAVRPLIELERQMFGKRPPADLDGHIGDGPAHDPS